MVDSIADTKATVQILTELTRELAGRPGYANLHADAMAVVRAAQRSNHPIDIQSAARSLNATAVDLFERDWLSAGLKGNGRPEQRVAAKIYDIALHIGK